MKQRVFSEIAPALARGEADFGVLIHEGRFTYEQSGLELVEDLGAAWEARTGTPSPLGGILARLDLDGDVHRRLAELVVESIHYARQQPEETLATMRRFAQELDDDVLWAHVRLYVNERTLDLGEEGERALDALHALAQGESVLGPSIPPLRVLG